MGLAESTYFMGLPKTGDIDKIKSLFTRLKNKSLFK